MRQPRKNKQTMFYALFNSSMPLYETDENGDIVYISVDGEMIPNKVGETREGYATPIKFKASISSSLNEMHTAAYGVSKDNIYQEILTEKNYVPLEIGTLIWRANKIEWEDSAKTIPKASSADYTVVGIMKEGLTEDFYLCKCNSSE